MIGIKIFLNIDRYLYINLHHTIVYFLFMVGTCTNNEHAEADVSRSLSMKDPFRDRTVTENVDGGLIKINVGVVNIE